jgi:hypothetical protein
VRLRGKRANPLLERNFQGRFRLPAVPRGLDFPAFKP